MDDSERVRRLTDKQKQVLRLVLHRTGSKDIARNLGLSPHTVDARLRAAIGVLGVKTRFEAARMLAAHESAYQPLICQTLDLPGEPPIGKEAVSGTNVVQEDRAIFEVADLDPRSPHDDLKRPARIVRLLGSIALLAFGSAVLIIAMIVVSAVVRGYSTGHPITIHY